MSEKQSTAFDFSSFLLLFEESDFMFRRVFWSTNKQCEKNILLLTLPLGCRLKPENKTIAFRKLLIF